MCGGVCVWKRPQVSWGNVQKVGGWKSRKLKCEKDREKEREREGREREIEM